MEETIAFTACKYLSFDRSKFVPSVKMARISSGGTTKIVWERKDPNDVLQLVQFCNRRGRINCPTGCLCKENAYAHCRDYEEFEHSVPVSDID